VRSAANTRADATEPRGRHDERFTADDDTAPPTPGIDVRHGVRRMLWHAGGAVERGLGS